MSSVRASSIYMGVCVYTVTCLFFFVVYLCQIFVCISRVCHHNRGYIIYNNKILAGYLFIFLNIFFQKNNHEQLSRLQFPHFIHPYSQKSVIKTEDRHTVCIGACFCNVRHTHTHRHPPHFIRIYT